MEEQVRQLARATSADRAAAEETGDVGMDAPRPARQARSPKHPSCATGASKLSKAPSVILAVAVAGCIAACGILRFAPGAEVAAALSVCTVLVLLGALLLLQRRVKAAFSTLATECARAQQLARLNSSVVESFAMAIDAKDQHTQGHTERVRDMAVAIGEEMGLNEEECKKIKTGAELHDIGKIGVKDLIIGKDSPLSTMEFHSIQAHVLTGEKILRPIEYLSFALPIIRHHHEKYDGTGYPDSLKGDKIPLSARIIGAADAFDAMTTQRPYNKPLPFKKALEKCKELKGKQFDAKVIDALDRFVTQNIKNLTKTDELPDKQTKVETPKKEVNKTVKKKAK